MKQINTHEDLLNALVNSENEDFDVTEQGSSFFVTTKWREYRVNHYTSHYVIELNLDRICTVKLSIKQLIESKNIELYCARKPQQVYDYFKPFMEDKRVD